VRQVANRVADERSRRKRCRKQIVLSRRHYHMPSPSGHAHEVGRVKTVSGAREPELLDGLANCDNDHSPSILRQAVRSSLHHAERGRETKSLQSTQQRLDSFAVTQSQNSSHVLHHHRARAYRLNRSEEHINERVSRVRNTTVPINLRKALTGRPSAKQEIVAAFRSR
jgi:hypothetical protein